MKNTLLLLLLLFIASLIQAQWDVYQNLDFCQYEIDSNTGKAHWQSNIFVDNANDIDVGNSKNNSFIKLSGAYTKRKPAYIFQEHPIEVDDFVKLRISAKLKGENITDGRGLIYCYTKKDNKRLQYRYLKKGALEGTKDWKEVSIDILIKPETNAFRIGAKLTGTGTLWIDDFQIEIIEFGNCEMKAEYLPFMRECMDSISRHSLYKEEIDTSKLLNLWERLSSCAKSIDEVHYSFRSILRLIDNHSFYMPLEKVNAWQNTSKSDQESNVTLCKGYHIDKNFACIWMPHFSSGDKSTGVMFANHLQNLIDSLDHKNIKGWVLDLRDNKGGNCWPMLAGIGPILGEGICGYFQYGDKFSTWKYQNGGSYMDDQVQSQVESLYELQKKNPPVAVLTSRKTTSSGEVVTVAFKNRPLSKSFGQKTGGYSTGNSNYTLSDGSMLFIASSVYADRNKYPYLHGISPDISIEDSEDKESDQVMKSAVQWLKDLNSKR